MLDGQRIDIKAKIHLIGGFSAHADQRDLLNFITRIPRAPKVLRIVHGSDEAKAAMKSLLERKSIGTQTIVP